MRSLLFLPLLFGFTGPAIADSEVFKIDVSAESYRNYILSGTDRNGICLLYTSPSPRDRTRSRMPSSA